MPFCLSQNIVWLEIWSSRFDDWLDFISFLSLPQRGKWRGKWGKRGWKSLFFITFFNFIHSKISKKIGFRGSAFSFPPSFSWGREEEKKITRINNIHLEMKEYIKQSIVYVTYTIIFASIANQLWRTYETRFFRLYHYRIVWTEWWTAAFNGLVCRWNPW